VSITTYPEAEPVALAASGSPEACAYCSGAILPVHACEQVPDSHANRRRHQDWKDCQAAMRDFVSVHSSADGKAFRRQPPW
jgi:hypothetical protein